MRNIDVGVRDVVALLNAIPGGRTRASCEGTSHASSPHRHADLAYVLLLYPLPLGLQEFLVARLDTVARVEPDGLYSRWPARNREFLARFEDALRAYQITHTGAPRPLRVPLATLRARLARRLVERESSHMSLCTTCHEVAVGEHVEAHAVVPLLHVSPDQALQWFAEFVSKSDNHLDPQLLAREGWDCLVARTHRGDFGQGFYRRWLRYRSRCLADLTTHQLRRGVEAVRRRGSRIDFYFDRDDAFFHSPGMDLRI